MAKCILPMMISNSLVLGLVGEPTPGTRAYRREGTFKECGEWLEKLGEYYKGDVGLSTSSVVLFVPVSRASVYKRIKEGKLTAFFFYVTHEETTVVRRKAQSQGTSLYCRVGQ